MLGSEVIKQIQNLIDEYGDLPIETCKSFYKNRKI